MCNLYDFFEVILPIISQCSGIWSVVTMRKCILTKYTDAMCSNRRYYVEIKKIHSFPLKFCHFVDFHEPTASYLCHGDQSYTNAIP